MEKLKNIRFNLDDKDDRALYDYLARLPRGEFSEKTKRFWQEKMEKERGEQK